MHNKFYIYFHINPVTNKVFYVGKGSNNRAYCINRNNFYNKIVEKHREPKIIIVKENISEKYAFLLEKAYIKIFGRRNLGLGPLTNLTDGGEGPSGHTHSEETKIKQSNASKGKCKSNLHRKNIAKCKIGNKNKLGKKASDETKKRMSESAKSRIPWNKGKKATKEHKLNMSKSRKGKNLGYKHTEETKRKISESNKGKQKRENHSQYGTKWISNLELQQCKKIKKEELNKYLELGWILGRKIKIKQ